MCCLLLQTSKSIKLHNIFSYMDGCSCMYWETTYCETHHLWECYAYYYYLKSIVFHYKVHSFIFLYISPFSHFPVQYTLVHVILTLIIFCLFFTISSFVHHNWWSFMYVVFKIASLHARYSNITRKNNGAMMKNEIIVCRMRCCGQYTHTYIHSYTLNTETINRCYAPHTPYTASVFVSEHSCIGIAAHSPAFKYFVHTFNVHT